MKLDGQSAAKQDREPIAYPDNAVLELEHVAKWLRVHPKTAETLPIRCKRVGERTRRYLGKWVREYMETEQESA